MKGVRYATLLAAMLTLGVAGSLSAQAAKALYAKLAPEQQPAADPRLANLMAMPLSQDAPRGRPGR